MKNKESEKRQMGITLESYKKCLVELDRMHMKGVIELKSLMTKSDKINKMISQAK